MGTLINNHLKAGYSDYNLLFVKRYYKELSLNDKILDIGCGHFRNLYLFKNLGFCNFYGIDKLLPEPSFSIDSDSAFFVDFVHQDITEGLKYNEKYFDIVLCNFVLMFMEHKHLENTINDILRVTKGFCIIETQKQFYKSKKSSMVDYDFKEIVKIIEGNNEFEILDKKIYKEKLIIRRKYNG